MEFLISRLAALNISDATEIVADCVDAGRIGWLIDYIAIREQLHDMEVEIYVQ